MAELPPVDNLFEFFRVNSAAIAPQLHLLVWGLGLLFVDFLLPERKIRFRSFGLHGKSLSVVFALVGLTMASYHLWSLWGAGSGPAFYNMVTQDSFALFFSALFLLSAFIAVILSYQYLSLENEQHTEYYALILFATAGMTFMAGAIDLVTIFVGLELMSISTYVLVGFLRKERRSNEASMKYFLMGAFSTAIMLYGMSLLYGISGSTNLSEIANEVSGLEDQTLLVLSLFTILAGLCFKIAAVPFHMWAPDAYEGAPTAITAFMSVGVKAAAFALFFRVVLVGFGDLQHLYVPILAVISIITMTWGNVAAMTQENVKRLLAYSSISHAGYVLMGLVAATESGVTAAAVYLLAYTFFNLGIWAVLISLRRQDVMGESIADFNGLFSRHPSLGVLTLVFLLSLAGIPPLAGFIAKYLVFAAVIEAAMQPQNAHATLLVWVAIAAAANAVVSLYYYIRIVVAMFIQEDYLPVPLSLSVGVIVTLVVTGIFTVLIGIYPDPFINLARTASLPLI